jgi:hypothetical protein
MPTINHLHDTFEVAFNRSPWEATAKKLNQVSTIGVGVQEPIHHMMGIGLLFQNHLSPTRVFNAAYAT